MLQPVEIEGIPFRQADIAKKYGIKDENLAQVFTGQRKPSPRITKAIADFFGFHPNTVPGIIEEYIRKAKERESINADKRRQFRERRRKEILARLQAVPTSDEPGKAG